MMKDRDTNEDQIDNSDVKSTTPGDLPKSTLKSKMIKKAALFVSIFIIFIVMVAIKDVRPIAPGHKSSFNISTTTKRV